MLSKLIFPSILFLTQGCACFFAPHCDGGGPKKVSGKAYPALRTSLPEHCRAAFSSEVPVFLEGAEHTPDSAIRKLVLDFQDGLLDSIDGQSCTLKPASFSAATEKTPTCRISYVCPSLGSDHPLYDDLVIMTKRRPGPWKFETNRNSRWQIASVEDES